MSHEHLDKHDAVHHLLFDENTAQVGSLGEVVEKHAGDAVFLGPSERSPGGLDGGISDFEAEVNETDPASDEYMDQGDLYSDQDGAPWATNQTGTVEGIARGFGTHLPQDIGRDGFQVEEIPHAALAMLGRPRKDGEELDDYDDADPTNGTFDPKELEGLSQPGTHVVADSVTSEAMPDRIHVTAQKAIAADDQLDATRKLK